MQGWHDPTRDQCRYGKTLFTSWAEKKYPQATIQSANNKN